MSELKEKIPKGYKQTEVGVIPEDWEVKRLGDVCGNITTGKLDANAMQKHGRYRFYTCAREYYYINEYAFDTEALLISGNGANVGYIHYFSGKFNAYQRTYVLTEFKENIFFIKLLLDRKLKDRIKTEVNAGNTPYITRGTLTDMTLFIPSTLSEQTAIANVLSDTDTLIEKLEKLIAKKKAIKRGAMQDLLTGKKRLPGFSGEWEVKKLEEVSDLKNGYSFKSSSYDKSGKYRIITITNVQDGYIDITETNKINILPVNLQAHQLLKINDILISMTGNVGRVCLVRDNNNLLNQRVGKLVSANIDKKFFFYICSGRDFLQKMILKAVGGAQGNIGKSDILEYETKLPTNLVEQTAIANILSNTDEEIESLEKKLEKYKKIKVGMMQQLLTGKIRIYEPAKQ